jgi:DNA-directed RNA polymerase beta' subunit
MRLEPLVVGFNPLLSVPFNVDTDLTVLADHCEKLAEAQAECFDPALRMALCGRLAAVSRYF